MTKNGQERKGNPTARGLDAQEWRARAEHFHSRLMAHLLKLSDWRLRNKAVHGYAGRAATRKARGQCRVANRVPATLSRSSSCQRMDTARGQMTRSGWRTRMQDAPENKKLTNED